MRPWALLICTVIALQSMVVRGETWSCSYTWGNVPKVFVRQRVDGGFTDPSHPIAHRPVNKVVFEDEKVIHLHSELLGEYYATVLSKTDGTFGMTSLRSDGTPSTGSVKGRCEVY